MATTTDAARRRAARRWRSSRALGFGPGIQAWYNQWIAPDPTRADSTGVPTRLVFGLEEVCENRLPLPLNGRSDFKAIGPYNATAAPACSCSRRRPARGPAGQPEQHHHPPRPARRDLRPRGQGGVTLVVGNDGGIYTQHVDAAGDFTRQGFGKGANDGLNTLLPYGADAAKDGIVYAGLQDNGEMRIEPDGVSSRLRRRRRLHPRSTPRHSNVAYEELPEAGINLDHRRRQTLVDIDPLLDNASFYAPLVMDPADPNHLSPGAARSPRPPTGPATTSPGTDNATTGGTVYDLGREQTRSRNQASAIAVRGRRSTPASAATATRSAIRSSSCRGLATNVGGSSHRRPARRRAGTRSRRRACRSGSSPASPSTRTIRNRLRDPRRIRPPSLRDAQRARPERRSAPVAATSICRPMAGSLQRHLRQLAADAGPLVAHLRGHRLLVATTVEQDQLNEVRIELPAASGSAFSGSGSALAASGSAPRRRDRRVRRPDRGGPLPFTLGRGGRIAAETGGGGALGVAPDAGNRHD